MTHFLFYLRYAARNLWRSKHWTTFAVFCVAAGVATVVALRSLGLSINDSLLSNLRQYNHGDINISMVGGVGPFSFSVQQGENERSIYNPRRVQAVQDWVDSKGGQMTAYTQASNIQITPLEGGSLFGRPQFISSFLVDPQNFALAHEIIASDPAGVHLRDLLTGEREVVISQNLADSLGLVVGEQVRVTGTEELFTVRGIVPTDTEANVNNLFASFFGFAYFDRAEAETMQLNPQPNTMGIILPNASEAEIDQAGLELLDVVIVRDFHTTPQLLRRNAQLSDMVGRLIVVMGLGALLIGGVGIVNTMLVMVGRRTMEIAALKTFGLKGSQISALFISESLLLGIVGSIVGVIAGVLLSLVVNQYGELLLQQPLPWRLHPEAMIYGVGLGMIVTVVFGVLPVLTATKVRPGIILRPNETHIPRAGLWQSIVAIVLVILVLGVITGNIIGPIIADAAEIVIDQSPNPILVGIAGVTVTLLVLAVLVVILWFVVWGVSRLPSFGLVDLRLALRNLTTRRLRTATTLLALTAGMFALSSITFFGLGAREIIRFQFSETLGGNIIILPLVPREIAEPLLNLQASLAGGIEHQTELNLNSTRITAVDGQRLQLEGAPNGVRLTIMARTTDNPALVSGPVLEGRDLTHEDVGRNVIVLSNSSFVEAALNDYSLADMGIGVGSVITLSVQGRSRQFEVVGLVGNANGFAPNIAGGYIPPDVPGTESPRQIYVWQVAPENLNDVLVRLSTVPLMFSLDVTFIDGLVSRLIEQLSAVPILVGLLSLLAAAVIMANTVSLATLERRRQIGILKALGLKRGRLLGVMLLENTLIGLLGGLLGIGISAGAVSAMTALGMGIAIPLPNEAGGIAVGLLVACVAIAWVATFLSARMAVNEQVLRVLRYD